jgi:hypothetical protein
VAFVWSRVRAELSESDPLLLVAGAGSIGVATFGLFLGRSPALSCLFVVVGCALAAVAAFTTTEQRELPRPVSKAVLTVVSGDAAPPRTSSRRLRVRHEYRKPELSSLASAMYLLLLLAITSVLLAAVVLAMWGVVFLVLGRVH